MMHRRALTAVGLLILASCGGEPTPGPAASPTTTRPRSTATIRIAEPESGAVVRGTRLLVKVEVKGARVLEKASTDTRPDTGHVHLYLDGKTVTLLAGLQFEITDLTPGKHLLQAEFSAADHGPFNPRVITATAFTVQ